VYAYNRALVNNFNLFKSSIFKRLIMLSDLTEKRKIVMGACLPRTFKEEIDQRRGDTPRSKYISRILEQIIHKENGNGNCSVEDRQSKSWRQPRQGPPESSDIPFTDSDC
jgi:hypothetical protein